MAKACELFDPLAHPPSRGASSSAMMRAQQFLGVPWRRRFPSLAAFPPVPPMRGTPPRLCLVAFLRGIARAGGCPPEWFPSASEWVALRMRRAAASFCMIFFPASPVPMSPPGVLPGCSWAVGSGGAGRRQRLVTGGAYVHKVASRCGTCSGEAFFLPLGFADGMLCDTECPHLSGLLADRLPLGFLPLPCCRRKTRRFGVRYCLRTSGLPQGSSKIRSSIRVVVR